MKKVLYPSLLSLGYAVLMIGFFSTDYSKNHSFLFKGREDKAPVMRRVMRPSEWALNPAVTVAMPVALVHEPKAGESPESAR